MQSIVDFGRIWIQNLKADAMMLSILSGAQRILQAHRLFNMFQILVQGQQVRGRRGKSITL